MNFIFGYRGIRWDIILLMFETDKFDSTGIGRARGVEGVPCSKDENSTSQWGINWQFNA